MNLVSHPEIHRQLLKRWEELDLSSADIIRDANERGMTVTASNLSKYKSAVKYNKDGTVKSMNFKGTLTFTQLIWLTTRFGIYVNINIGTLTIQEGKPIYKVEPYDELLALKRLKRVFPNLYPEDVKEK